MTGTLSVNVTETRGEAVAPIEVDRYACVIGCTSTGSGLSSALVSASGAVSARGYGDCVDDATQIILQQQDDGQPATQYPVAIYTVPGDTVGSYGAIDVSDFDGTALPVVGSTAPYITAEARLRFVAGGTLGTAGITYVDSLDDGRHESFTKRLGTNFTITIPESNASIYLGAPEAQVTAFIAAAVEAGTDTLAHLADVTAHDAADTSAAQVALAAASAPTTEAQAWAYMNLVYAALASHVEDVDAHNGPDIVNVPSSTTASNGQTGIARYNNYRTHYNAHIAATFAASSAGLKAATASVTTTVTITSADLLTAGVAAILANPRRITITTAGGTASDAPATATITGTDADGAALVETVNVSQSAGSVSTVAAFKTITSITHPVGQGTGATMAYGYGQGVHNSADATNTLTATAPTHGTVVAGDEIAVRTFAPAPNGASVTAALNAIAAGSSPKFGILVLEFPLDATMAALVKTGINTIRDAKGYEPVVLARTRLPDFEDGETVASWKESILEEFEGFTDSRIVRRDGYGLLTDARSGRQYLRSGLGQFAADVVRVPRSVYPCAPNDRPIPNYTLVDANGAMVGYDEGPEPRGTGSYLSNSQLNGRGSCEQRIPGSGLDEAVYNAIPWTMYDADENIRTLMVRRIANAMKRVARAAAILNLGQKLSYVPATAGDPTSRDTLTAESLYTVHSSVYGALASEFADDIQNADDAAIDTGLVRVNPQITVASGNIATVTVGLHARPFGYLGTVNLQLAVEE